jgi:hypothetical protein
MPSREFFPSTLNDGTGLYDEGVAVLAEREDLSVVPSRARR